MGCNLHNQGNNSPAPGDTGGRSQGNKSQDLSLPSVPAPADAAQWPSPGGARGGRTARCRPCRSDLQGQGEEVAVSVGEGPADISSALGERCTHCQTTAWQWHNPFFFTPISCQDLYWLSSVRSWKAGKPRSCSLLGHRAGQKRVQWVAGVGVRGRKDLAHGSSANPSLKNNLRRCTVAAPRSLGHWSAAVFRSLALYIQPLPLGLVTDQFSPSLLWEACISLLCLLSESLHTCRGLSPLMWMSV